MYLDPKNISKTYPKHLLKRYVDVKGTISHILSSFSPTETCKNLCQIGPSRASLRNLKACHGNLMALPYDDFRHKLLKDRSLSVLLAFLLVG